jgi:type IV pilus assembly protein PilV
MTTSSQRQSGFSLIETLVTLVILAFGLLGLAGLHSVSLKNNLASQWRAQATIYGYDIIEKMRSNCGAAHAGSYDISLSASTPSGDGDVATWRKGLADNLLSGKGSVLVDSGNRQAAVVIQWDESRVSGGSSTHQVQINGVLPPSIECS